jgi:phosphoribosyl 1,2-cyclic phosphodiesterase
MMRFASLGSGSGGNALLVEADGTRVLVDCGLTLREVERGLARIGLAPDDLKGVLVTHEHDDHIGGVFPFVAKHGLRAWMTYGTREASLAMRGAAAATIEVIDSHDPFVIGDLEIHPIPVPHDAREPVQYVLSDGDRRLGVMTDIGAPTPHVTKSLSGVDALVLECNHDVAMLAAGRYPGWLKQRVGGPYGHLSNVQAASLLESLDRGRLKHLIAAHLSERNNLPTLAQTALAQVLGCTADEICVASQSDGFDWRML